MFPKQEESLHRDTRIAPVILRLLSVTMIFTMIAAAVEWYYLTETGLMTDIERVAIIVAAAGFVLVFVAILAFGGSHLNLITVAIGAGGNFYILLMTYAALFLGESPEHVLHTGLWLHPLFIVFTLTRSTLQAQIVCWGNIFILCLFTMGFAFFSPNAGSSLHVVVELIHLALSLSASAIVLYGLSVYRQMQGADHARVESMEQITAALRAEAKATEAAAQASEQARAALEQANGVIASFLDNMSHELRTPLNAIIGFSELIHGELFGALANEKYKEYAGDILGSGQNLLELVNNLLYFSKLSAGKISMNLDDLDAAYLLHRVADAERGKAETARVDIIVDVLPASRFWPQTLMRPQGF